MKKYLSLLLAFIVTVAFTTTSLADTSGNSTGSYTLIINGEVVDTDIAPLITSKSPLVPAKAMFEKLGGVTEWDVVTRTMNISINNNIITLQAYEVNATINDTGFKLDIAPRVIKDCLMVPVSVANALNVTVEVSPDEKLIKLESRESGSELQAITYSPESGADRVDIGYGGGQDYKIMRLTGPDRIVLDFPGKLNQNQNNEESIYCNGKYIKNIRYAQYSPEVTRIVLDVPGQMDYRVEENNGVVSVYVTAPVFSTLKYNNNGDRVFICLNGSNLTEGGEKLKKNYTGAYGEDGKQYIITFPSKFARIETGVMKINDGLLDSIEVMKSPDGQETSIILNAKENFVYQVFSRTELKDTAITILKPAGKGEKLVVIDPGHGGFDPGAKYAGYEEKNLNLDIAMRLNRMLKEKNIKTYMIREDDSFVGLYERGYIANSLNTSLFLSIHNNATDNKNYDGTMTLYYPQKASATGFNGKRLAQLIQNSLLKTLKTTDRKIIERPNLVVLKSTAMPAALAEVGFMTNTKDMNNLKKAEFRENAASALCDAVIQALNEIK